MEEQQNTENTSNKDCNLSHQNITKIKTENTKKMSTLFTDPIYKKIKKSKKIKKIKKSKKIKKIKKTQK